MSNGNSDGAKDSTRVRHFGWWLVTDPLGRWITGIATLSFTAIAVIWTSVMDPLLWLMLVLLWIGESSIILSELINRV